MTPKEFFETLARGVADGSVLTFQPGPIQFMAGKQDDMAARLLLWLSEQMPADATYGELDDVLDAAKFWSTFWGSLSRGT